MLAEVKDAAQAVGLELHPDKAKILHNIQRRKPRQQPEHVHFNSMDIEILPYGAAQIILVANETNMGVIPLGELSRRYCDQAGILHQRVAQLCDRVILTVAGLPHVLKGEPL